VSTLKELIDQLPPDLQEKVKNYAESLLINKMKKKKGKPEFMWAGVLKNLKDQYTSVELQHDISRWRVRDE